MSELTITDSDGDYANVYMSQETERIHLRVVQAGKASMVSLTKDQAMLLGLFLKEIS